MRANLKPWAAALQVLSPADYDKATPVGSRYILPIAPVESDLDILVLTSDLELVALRLTAAGFEREGGEHYPESEFRSYRKGDVNFIITEDPVFFDKFKVAAEVCRYLRLSSRDQRINVHNIIIRGESA